MISTREVITQSNIMNTPIMILIGVFSDLLKKTVEIKGDSDRTAQCKRNFEKQMRHEVYIVGAKIAPVKKKPILYSYLRKVKR